MPSRQRSERHEAGRKDTEGGRGHAARPSPIEVERFLKGIDFPASKDDLIEHAQDNRAPGDVLKMLDMLDDKEYNSVVDITKEVGKYE